MKSVLTYSSLYFSISCAFNLCFAQENLIPNHGFEELRDTTLMYPCPTSTGQIVKANYWKSADGSVDYYNACSNDLFPNFGVPWNWMGFQEAFEGEAYAGIGIYSEVYPDIREYLWIELPNHLRTGQGYYFEMQVSLNDSPNFAVSGLGALFTSDDTRYWGDEDFFDAIPQVENSQSNLLDDRENWMRVGGQFVAQGGEKYLTIGLFRTDAEDNIQRVSSNPFVTENWEYSAYFIDGVVLLEDNSIGIWEQETISTTIYPNPTEGEGITLAYAMQQNATAQWEITDIAGRTVHVQALQGNEGRVTLGMRLPQGIYLSAVVADGVRMGVEKLVVQ